MGLCLTHSDSALHKFLLKPSAQDSGRPEGRVVMHWVECELSSGGQAKVGVRFKKVLLDLFVEWVKGWSSFLIFPSQGVYWEEEEEGDLLLRSSRSEDKGGEHI